jgi:hypothetical protein
MKQLLLSLIAALALGITSFANNVTISGPNGEIVAVIRTNNKNELTYSVKFKGHVLIKNSSLGVTVNHIALGENVFIASQIRGHQNEKKYFFQSKELTDNEYNFTIIHLQNSRTRLSCSLEFRVFNDGIAYRYIIPSTETLLISKEASSWKIPEHSTVWYQQNTDYYEGLHYSGSADSLTGKIMGPPVTFLTPDNIYGVITEAALLNYSGMSLFLDSSDIFRAHFKNDTSGWKISDTAVSPWRVLMVSRNLNGLVNSNIINSLNKHPDSTLTNADWIKPGRAVWSYFEHGNVTTEKIEKDYIDKASELGFEYNMVDAGWETSWTDKWKSLQDLVDYGKEKNVGIWVWKSYPSLKDQNTRREFFRRLHNIGVVGVKIDFIDREGIDQVLFYEDALRDAANEKLMIDFHGADKPTGLSRTFPNELTREAIYGQEWRTPIEQGATNNTTIPFTRLLAGPADATPGVFNSKLSYGTSRSHQLALTIILYSPLSCWPEDPDVYLRSSAADLIKSLPTTWDETFVFPQSRIGHLAAFARRKDSTWFVAVINGNGEKELTIPLTFLKQGNFIADIFKDDFTNADNFFHSKTAVYSSDSFHVYLRAKGGFVARISKSNIPRPSLNIFPQKKYLIKPELVSIKSNHQNLQIRYTLDGTVPDGHSKLYTEPITVRDHVVITSELFNGDQATNTIAVQQFILAPAPAVYPDETLFLNTQHIRLSKNKNEGNIYYTVDGSPPTISSIPYQKEITINRTTTINAKVFSSSGFPGEMMTKTYTQVSPLAAQTIENPIPGLRYKFYKGSWEYLPDFNHLTENSQGIVKSVNLDSTTTEISDFGLWYEGFYNAPSEGIYKFYTVSDDGSRLFIDGEKIVDNDGSHGDLEKSGSIALSKGLHNFSLFYFQNSSGKSLNVYVEEPGKGKAELQPASFFHK